MFVAENGGPCFMSGAVGIDSGTIVVAVTLLALAL